MNRRTFLRSTSLAATTTMLGLGYAARAAESAVVLNLEPGRANPRNSEGSFVTLKSGRILLYYTSFYGGAGDESPARIVSLQSDDAGQSWTAAIHHPVPVAHVAVAGVTIRVILPADQRHVADTVAKNHRGRWHSLAKWSAGNRYIIGKVIFSRKNSNWFLARRG